MATKIKTKRGRGRPVKPVNFSFGKGGKGTFTIDQVLGRYNRKGAEPKISRAAVYNKLMAMVGAKRARVVKHEPLNGRGHPNYRYQLVA